MEGRVKLGIAIACFVVALAVLVWLAKLNGF